MSFSAGSTIARASSGSRSCSSSVEPLISANSAVTVLRSPSIAKGAGLSSVTRMPEEFGAAAFKGAALAVALKALPHCAQNLATGGFSKPHCAHRRLIGVAHSMQNFAPSGFSAEQFWQRIVDSLKNQRYRSVLYHPTSGGDQQAARETITDRRDIR